MMQKHVVLVMGCLMKYNVRFLLPCVSQIMLCLHLKKAINSGFFKGQFVFVVYDVHTKTHSLKMLTSL